MNATQRGLLAMLLGLLAVSLLVAAGSGAYTIAPWNIPDILWNKSDGYAVLVHIRFPRVCLGAVVGAVFGVSGAALQGLFRNPLADPGLLGINAGAGFGAAAWIVLIGGATLGVWGVPLAAFAGALLVTVIAWHISQHNGQIMVATLLLAGIALNSFAAAGIGLMTFLADDQQLRNLTFWMLGGLGGATWWVVMTTAIFAALSMAVQMRLAQPLNLMSFGEQDAYHMGVSTHSLKRQVVTGATLGVATAVAAAGGIGFIGLVVPHILRLFGGADHRFLLPASALGGALLLVLADLIARTIAMPQDVPVGIVTALIGAPFLTWLLVRAKQEVLYA